jgi:hypothetical protein
LRRLAVYANEQAAGNIVRGDLAAGRAVALINASLQEQLPRGIALVEPRARLTCDAVWQHDEHPRIQRTLDVASRLALEAG